MITRQVITVAIHTNVNSQAGSIGGGSCVVFTTLFSILGSVIMLEFRHLFHLDSFSPVPCSKSPLNFSWWSVSSSLSPGFVCLFPCHKGALTWTCSGSECGLGHLQALPTCWWFKCRPTMPLSVPCSEDQVVTPS